MCLYLNYTKVSKAKATAFFNRQKTATKDIIVYKALFAEAVDFDGEEIKFEFVSVYMRKLWIRGETKKIATFGIELEPYSAAEELVYRATIHRGLHAYTTEAYAKSEWGDNQDVIIFKCIIPKGTKYFVGADGNEIATLLMHFPTHEEESKLK
jgi:hypothetical protein